MAFDVKRLRLGEKIAGASALLLFVALFLRWYGAEQPVGAEVNFSLHVNAWDALGFILFLLLLVIVATLAFVVLTATQRAPALPVAASVVITVLGAIATLFVLYRIVNPPGPNAFVAAEYGAYIALLCCLGITLGGFLAMREEGTSFDDARAQADGLLKGRERTRPAPATADADAPRAGDASAPPAAEGAGASTPQGPPPGTVPPAREEPPRT